MNEYKVLSTIGEGAHGIVLKAKHKGVLERIVALKKITMKKVVKEGIPLQVIREIKALQFVEHENVVQLFDVFPHGISFVLVFEFMPSNLWEILHAHTLKGSQAKCYMKMILKGLDYLHTNHILHRVYLVLLKSSNNLCLYFLCDNISIILQLLRTSNQPIFL